jgi:hypothetical protein
MRRVSLQLSSLLATVLIGCGGGSDMLPVTGAVKYGDGSPVTGQIARVIFQPVGDQRAATATIEVDGSFKAMTEKPGDGMAPGEYKVVLNVLKDYRENILGVPEKYADGATTPLSIVVDADHTHFDLVVEK